MRLSWARTLGLLIPVLLLEVSAARATVGSEAYLQLLVGARPMGMGGAFAGLADDVTALFFNPAGISAIPERQATAMHAELSFDRSFNYLAASFPNHKGQSGWGISYTNFQVNGIPETRVVPGTTTPIINADGTVTIFSLFDNTQENFTVTYAWAATENLRVGLTGRLLHRDIGRQEANGYGSDVGVLFQASKDVRVGLNLQNIFASIREDATLHRDIIPFTATLGGSVRAWQDVILVLDIFKVDGEDGGIRFGAEKWWGDRYALRLGLNDGDFTAGAGIKYRAFQFDYAYQTQELGDINRVSFIYHW
jgi:hypothetical protein